MLTISIIIVTALVSLYAFSKQEVFDKFCLYPYAMHQKRGEYFRFISVGFVHADFAHLFLNMLTLWFFGSVLEKSIFSEAQYLLFYMSALFFSSINEYGKQKDNPEYKACGASGAVSAVLFSLVLFEPWGVIYLKFIIPIYFILFAIFYHIYSWYKSKNQTDNIAHGVHLWGALYGIAFTLLVKPESLSIFLDVIMHPPFIKYFG